MRPNWHRFWTNFGDSYSKYVLNLNGHSHNYERYHPIHGVTHITSGGGGSSLETPWSSTDPRTAYRAMHMEHLRVDVQPSGMRIEAVCGPASSKDDITCVEGSVFDSYTIGTPPPPNPPPAPTLYVDRNNASCSDSGPGTAAQPFCKIAAGVARATAGTTVLVFAGTYPEMVQPRSGAPNAPITFAAAPGNTVTVTGGTNTNGFWLSGKSWITIEGFNVTGTTGDGIYVSKSSNIQLHSNHVSNSGRPVSGQVAKGIRLNETTDSVVSNNTVDHNTDYGIYLLAGSTRNQIIGNHVFENARQFTRAASGIRIYAAPGNTISSNVSHDNEDSGVEFVTGANDNLAVNNVTYENDDHGIDVYSSTGERVIGNSVYKNVTAGINVEGVSTGATIANNISVDNGINSPRTKSNIRVESGSTSGTTMDYDVVRLTASGPLLIWNSVSYTSLASFRSATGQEAHGIQADPIWKSPTTGDFHLMAGSPAIDSANSGASGQSTVDAEGLPRINDPSTPNTGVGPRAYDDRGAHEFEPEEDADSPPNAMLTVTPDSGTAPLQVTADASGSTDPDPTPIDTYAFNFGDGTPVVGPQTGATAGHTYQAAGTYTVTVTVTDTAGLVATASTQVVVDAPDLPPNAALTVTPDEGTVPLSVTADASGSTDTDATPIDTYRFDFGDGTVTGPQTTATAGHTYMFSGTYTVTVTVTDTAGQSSTATAPVAVAAANDDPPIASLTVTPGSGPAPLQVTADASGSTDTDATPIDNYRFNFGDGTPVVGPQAGATAVHTYQAAGTYTVTVTVTDTAGLSSTKTAQVTALTNLVMNPGFETNLAGWNTSGSDTGVSLTRVAGGHSGSWAARLGNPTTTSRTCALNDSPDWAKPSSAGTYTGAIWLRADVAGALAKVKFREYSGSTLVGSAVTLVTLTTSWQPVSVDYTIVSPGSSLDFNAYVTGAAPGTCFYADDVSVIRR